MLGLVLAALATLTTAEPPPAAAAGDARAALRAERPWLDAAAAGVEERFG